MAPVYAVRTVDVGWALGAARRWLRRSAVKMDEGSAAGVVSARPNFSLALPCLTHIT